MDPGLYRTDLIDVARARFCAPIPRVSFLNMMLAPAALSEEEKAEIAAAVIRRDRAAFSCDPCPSYPWASFHCFLNSE